MARKHAVPMTAADRKMRAQMAAHASWANTGDRRARSKPGGDALVARFERQVDPDGVLPAAERAARAESAKRAYYVGLAYKSARARRARAVGGVDQ